MVLLGLVIQFVMNNRASGGPPEQNARGPQWHGGFHYIAYLSGYFLCFRLFHGLQLPGHAIHVH